MSRTSRTRPPAAPNRSLPSLILAQSALMIADHETHSMVRARPVGRRSDLAAILAEAQQALEINFEDGFTLSSCDDDFSIASFGSDTDFPDKVTANALRASIVFELKKAEESSSLPKRRQRQRMTDVFENDSLHLKHSNRVRRIAPITSVEPKSEAPAVLKRTRRQTRPTDGLEDGFEKDSLHLKQTRRVPRRKCRNHDVEVLVEPDLEFSGEVFEIPLKY